jgi:hypothetical protein
MSFTFDNSAIAPGPSRFLTSAAAQLETLTDAADRADYIEDCKRLLTQRVNAGSVSAFDGSMVAGILDGWRQMVREAA